MSWYNPYGAQPAYSSFGDPYARRGRAPPRMAPEYSSWVDDEEEARSRRALEEMYRRGPAPAQAQQQPQRREMENADGRAQAQAQALAQQQQAQAQAYAQQQQAQAYAQQHAQQQAPQQAPPRPVKTGARGARRRRASIPAPLLPPPKPTLPKRAPSASPPTRPAPVPPVQQPATKPPRPAPTEDELAGAADTITRHWRRRQVLRQIDARAARFQKLRREFVFPPVLDYELGEGRVESVHAPPPAQILDDAESDVEEEEEGEMEEREKGEGEGARLAFTPKNTPVHAYAEALLRVLNELDAVESGGDARVRERRRAVVRAVEGEAARVERWWRAVWRRRGESGDAAGKGAPEVGGRGRRRSRGRR